MSRFLPSLTSLLFLGLFLFGAANLFTVRVVSGDAGFPSGHYYFFNRFHYSPKMGDWVVYSLPGILGGNCGGAIIGQVSPPKPPREAGPEKYTVLTIPRTECDSRYTGPVDRRDIRGRIYPEREIKFVTKFWNSRFGLVISRLGSEKSPPPGPVNRAH